MAHTVVVVDIDGTLVDSNYHHVFAWSEAFAAFHRQPPVWQIHRTIGMGGDQLVEALTDAEFEQRHGDAVRQAHTDAFARLIDQVRPLPGARDFLSALGRMGATLVLASSADKDEVGRYIELLDACAVIDGWTTADDVSHTKPDPEPIRAALTEAGGTPSTAVLIGDSVWDVQAGRRAGVAVIGVRTGGYGAGELLDAGAEAVFDVLGDIEFTGGGSGALTVPCLS
jgi:HAD superfamily hydrolase (TIGR01509 family)